MRPSLLSSHQQRYVGQACGMGGAGKLGRQWQVESGDRAMLGPQGAVPSSQWLRDRRMENLTRPMLCLRACLMPCAVCACPPLALPPTAPPSLRPCLLPAAVATMKLKEQAKMLVKPQCE